MKKEAMDLSMLKGKKIAVSGSTGGIGREICKKLAAAGADLIFIDRNPDKAKKLMDEIKNIAPELHVKHIQMDMERIESVISAAETLIDGGGIDAVILSAGAYHIPRRTCDTGLDNIFQINFVGPYILADLLRESIEKRNGRIAVVGSISYALARYDEKDRQYLNKKSAERVYGNAKRCLMLAVSRLYGDSGMLSLTHPGIVPTGITGGYSGFVRALIKYPMKLLFMSPEKASDCVLCGLTRSTPEGFWIGPRTLGIWGRHKMTALRGYSREEAERIIDFVDNIKNEIITKKNK